MPEANAPKLTTLRAPPLPGFPKASTIAYPSARTGHPRVDAQLRKALEGLWRKRQRDYAAFLREEGGNAKKRGFELTQDITCGATLATRYALSVDCVGLEEGGGAHPTKVDLTLNLELCAEGVRPLSLARLFRAHSGYRKALAGAWANALSPEIGEGFDPEGCFADDQDPLAAFALLPGGLRFVTADVPFVCGGLRGDVPVASFRPFLRADGPAARVWP